MLELTAVTVSYGDQVALDSVDMTVADAEIVSVLGPSGSGKSTLLRAIAGLVPEAHGRVSWDGADVSSVPTHRRGFGLMFQDHALFPHRDVLGNVACGVRMHGLPRPEVDERARAALARVGLTGFEHRRITELSGGEQQRVALARALAPEPGLLMLDEPLGALDRSLRERLVSELRVLFTRLHLSVIFVTHDHDEAFALADRVVVMHDGRIAQQGTPADLWNEPANAFVARFLGWNVTDTFGPTLAVRPDDVVLSDDHDDTGVRGTVVGRTFRRDHYLLEIELPRNAGPEILRAAHRLDSAVPDVGDAVRVALHPSGPVVHL